LIRPGIVSITFRLLSPQKIIDLVADNGLEGIEWGGDVHVPHGNTQKAKQVARQTKEAGLKTAAYGSYYIIGQSEEEGLNFEKVLETAQALRAPLIRVWAGTKESTEADEDYYKTVAEQTRRICKMAASADISIAYEFHCGTLTNTALSAMKLINQVDCENLYSLWQPIYGASPETNCQTLELLSSKVKNVHIFHWWPTNNERQLLEDGTGHWKQYIDKLVQIGGEHYALIEFVKDDKIDNFVKDAKCLSRWLKNP
jgi:3-dehydroshikimate dehydratase